MNNASSLYAQSFGNLQILGAASFIVLAILTSWFFKLRLGKDLLIASLRTTVQLILIGYVLRWLLHADSLFTNLITLLVMTLVAAQAAHSRLKEKTWKIYFACFTALLASVWPLGLFCIEAFFGGEAFRNSLFFIPFMGVLMGNALNAISLSFVGLEKNRRENQLEIETMKALGATPFEASHRLYSETLRNAMTPNINGMTVVGIVSLPGVMAGQLIGGVDPLVAARFQILVMFLITFVSLVGSVFAVLINHFYFMPPWVLQSPSGRCFPIQSGDKVLLRGPSGIGKSRLLKSLAGLDIPEIYQRLVLPKNFALTEVKSNEMLYVPQKAFFVPGTVQDNLAYPFQFKKHLGQKLNSHFFEENLEKLGMSLNLLEKNAMTLSGGEAQIIHLLRSLQFEPSILLLDEITAALDSERTSLVDNFLKEWVCKKPERSIVFISHRREQAQEFANHTLTLAPLDGTTDIQVKLE